MCSRRTEDHRKREDKVEFGFKPVEISGFIIKNGPKASGSQESCSFLSSFETSGSGTVDVVERSHSAETSGHSELLKRTRFCCKGLGFNVV